MRLNILLVDDSLIIRTMIARTIEMAGIPTGRVYHAQNGLDALDTMRNNWIDLVFADINMPVMDGVEMIEKMAADEALSQIPVIVVSTEGSETKIDRLWRNGIRAFVRKPFTPETIRDAVRMVLGEWDMEEAGNGFKTGAF